MFLYRKENALSPELCESFIKEFEDSNEKHPGVVSNKEGINVTSTKKSTDLSLNPTHFKDAKWGPILKEFIPILYKGYEDYYDRYSTGLSNAEPVDISLIFNVQKYSPGEGFYDWHCESSSLKTNHRQLVWMVYLNTLTDRGETAFFYQQHYEEPKQGKLLIWPADWTYTHKGVSSPSQTKYILTGWFDYTTSKVD